MFVLVVLLLHGHVWRIHKSTSLMSSSLLLQLCPVCLVRLTWIVFVIGGRWPYSWCLVGCCRQDLFKIARSILVSLPSSVFSSRFVSVHVVHPYSSIDVTAAWKKLRFILSVFKQFSLAWVYSLIVKTVLIQLIQFSISVDFVYTHMSKQFYIKQFNLA